MKRALIVLLGLVGLAAWGLAQLSPFNPSRATLEDERNTTEIVRLYGPSVVAVNVSLPAKRLEPFCPMGRLDLFRFRLVPQAQSSGSGFVIQANGQIVTAYHVIRGAMQEGSAALREGARIEVRFPGGAQNLPVRVLGVNPDYDLALLELADPKSLPANAQPIPLGDSDRLEVGQKVIAIGNPFGLQSTVTTGVISAVGREIPTVGRVRVPMIQTDAALNPGSSGGPLLDAKGELIGISTAIVPGLSVDGRRAFVGVGFAIPSNYLRDNLAQLQQGGLQRVSQGRPRIGIQVRDLSDYPERLRRELNLPDSGVMVVAVERNSPAAKAHLQPADLRVSTGGRVYPAGGDVILEVDGRAVKNSAELQQLVFAKKAGDTVQLTLWRSGKRESVAVTLEVLPQAG
jgi:S1-C subfamily serine protease